MFNDFWKLTLLAEWVCAYSSRRVIRVTRKRTRVSASPPASSFSNFPGTLPEVLGTAGWIRTTDLLIHS
jgi:hypothetical protein